MANEEHSAEQPEEGITLTPEQIALASGEEISTEEQDEKPEDVSNEQELPEQEDEASEEVESSPEPPAPDEWITADIVARASAYGIDRKDLDGFSNKEEFGRALRLIDRTSANTLQPKEQEKQEEKAPKESDGLIDPEAYAKEYDDDVVNLARATRALQEQLKSQSDQYEQLQSTWQEQQQRQAMDMFHDELDRLSPEFYGKSLDESGPRDISEQEAQRRQEVYNAAVEVHRIAQSRGQNLSWPALVKRAHELVFAEEVKPQKKDDAKEKAARIAAQSKKRRPVASGKTTAVPGQGKAFESPAEIASIPEVAKFFQEAQRA